MGLICQRARSRKDLDYADETQEKEHCPDTFVALEEIAYFLFHFFFFLFYGPYGLMGLK